MSKWLTPEEIAALTGNSTANAAEMKPAPAAAAEKSICPHRFMAETQKRHKLISNLHLVISILIAILLFQMVFIKKTA